MDRASTGRGHFPLPRHPQPRNPLPLPRLRSPRYSRGSSRARCAPGHGLQPGEVPWVQVRSSSRRPTHGERTAPSSTEGGRGARTSVHVCGATANPVPPGSPPSSDRRINSPPSPWRWSRRSRAGNPLGQGTGQPPATATGTSWPRPWRCVGPSPHAAGGESAKSPHRARTQFVTGPVSTGATVPASGDDVTRCNSTAGASGMGSHSPVAGTHRVPARQSEKHPPAALAATDEVTACVALSPGPAPNPKPKRVCCWTCRHPEAPANTPEVSRANRRWAKDRSTRRGL